MPPGKLQALLHCATTHHKAGRLVEAERIYRQARLAAPRNCTVLLFSGLLASQQGRMEDAVDLLARAHHIDRKNAPCAMNLGLALLEVGRAAEAETAVREAIEVQPDSHECWNILACSLKTQGRLQEALVCNERCVAAKPDFALGWYNYAINCSELGLEQNALRCHERVLQFEPSNALALHGRGQLLVRAYRLGEAVQTYEAALAARPNYHEARSSRLLALQYIAGVGREQIFEEHLAYGRAVGTDPFRKFANSPDPTRRLRLAILSEDLREHSCSYFLEPLLQHLDRQAVELCLYHDHFQTDEVSARLQSLAHVWRNFFGQSNQVVEAAIRADAPDILIDLSGHTGKAQRLPLYARRLAPVQISYLGYPDTTGLSAMDYRFTDATADPEGEADRFATEELVRFAPTAWTYTPPVDAPPVSPSPATSSAPFTFGCFSNPSKISDPLLALWRSVLDAVPESRLVLKGRGFQAPELRDHFRARLTRAGLPVDRIAFIERTPTTASHLALYRHIDVALDTFPYHGTTTTCESLWMGVPVVTIAGDRHAARVGVSLLQAAGHPEWIAQSADAYGQIAAELAGDLPRLDAIRRGLRIEMQQSALLDHVGQAARFCAALRKCWGDWCRRQIVPN